MRILIVQTAYLGDVVLTLPLLVELRRALPEAELWTLTTATGSEVLAGEGVVDRRLAFDKRWRRQVAPDNRATLQALRTTRFDAAIAAHRSLRSGLLLRLTRAPQRVGFAGAAGAWAYNCRIPWRPAEHAIERYLALSAPLGGTGAGRATRPRLSPDPLAVRRVTEHLARHSVREGEPVLVLAPGSRFPTKRWHPLGFATLIAAARARGLVPVLVGSPDERELCGTISTLAHGGAIPLAGETSIAELIALASRARAVVAHDSGAAHVAAAVGTPVLSIFGSTSPSQGYAPRGELTRVVEHPGLACRPCGRHGRRRCPLGHFACMNELEAERVVARLDELLAAGEAGRGELQSPGRALPG